MKVIIDKLKILAETGDTFDLKKMISLYVLDILGEVAFSRPFGAQIRNEAEQLQAINDHIFLSSLIGELPFSGFLENTLEIIAPGMDATTNGEPE